MGFLSLFLKPNSMETEMIIKMAITATVTFVFAYIVLYLVRRYRWHEKALKWLNYRLPWNAIARNGIKIKIGSFELEIYPKNDRHKLYIQRYGKRD
jgi:hypothetical protein